MNIHDRSSLLLVPSGYKDGKLYSQVPNSGDGDFTFTRGSNLAATRVGADGLIEKGRENLLLQSNQFDTTWNKSGVTVESGYEGYDGTNDAWLLTKLNISNRIEQSISGSGVTTFSVYFKAGTLNWAILNIGGISKYFDLQNGILGNTTGVSSYGIDFGIESVGNGWYRGYATTNQSYNIVRIYPANDNGDNTGPSGTIYIQDAQLEVGLAATDYIESGATTGKAGILENQPRFDYSGGASRASLLLEPSRTNLVTSEYFEPSATDWRSEGNNGVTITTNDTTSPEGLVNASKLQGGGASNDRLQWNFNTSNTKAVYSIFVKGTGDAVRFSLFNSRSGDRLSYDVDTSGNFTLNAATGITNYNIENYGNGWYRIWGEFTTDAALANYFQIYSDITGSGAIYLYGAQLEDNASYPTSYIPTYGASVTRSEDATSELALSPSYGSSNTWFFELKRIPDTSLLNQPISIIKNDSTGASNRFTIMSTSNGRLRVLLSDENGTTENLYSPDNSFEQGETIKAVVKITPSGCTLFVDGASAATSSSVGAITGIDAITYFKNVALNQFLVFPTALSDTDCELLTGTTYESFAAMAEALNYTVYE